MQNMIIRFERNQLQINARFKKSFGEFKMAWALKRAAPLD